MKYIIGMIATIVAWIMFLVIVPMPEYRVYDCGMAEWHPDIPPKVKEECRRRALEYWREEQNKKTI
jgi:uncharacterized short protein YbdD (DUF466 family)